MPGQLTDLPHSSGTPGPADGSRSPTSRHRPGKGPDYECDERTEGGDREDVAEQHRRGHLTLPLPVLDGEDHGGHGGGQGVGQDRQTPGKYHRFPCSSPPRTRYLRLDQRLSISKVRWQRKFPVHGRASSNLSRTRTLWARCDVACVAADRAKARRSGDAVWSCVAFCSLGRTAQTGSSGRPGPAAFEAGTGVRISGGLALPRSQGRVPPVDLDNLIQVDPGRPTAGSACMPSPGKRCAAGRDLAQILMRRCHP